MFIDQCKKCQKLFEHNNEYFDEVFHKIEQRGNPDNIYYFDMCIDSIKKL